jgi:membrane protease subunit HflK
LSKLRLALGLLFAGLVASSSIVAVDSGNVAVVYRFGAIDRAMGPGLNLRAPWPIESHQVVAVSEVRRIEPGRTRMLTGDTNLVDVDLVIQTTISDPIAYLVGLQDPDKTLSSIVLASTADVVSTVGVDALLTTGRTELQTRVAAAAQAALDEWGAGIRVAAIEVRELSPPEVVVDAFNDVSSARGDRETLALAAEAYASERLPGVRGEAGALKESARALAAMRGAQASGEVARFTALQTEAKRAPAATRGHLWSKTAAQVGATVQVHVIKDDTEIRVGGAL